MNETNECPICSAEINYFERYPNQVCERCKTKASDAYGRRLVFSNENLSGGFIAFYRGTEEKYKSRLCYIDGIRCHASEHRFGGIVVEVVK
jgi:protein-arginine kinase activator protein McsA